MNFIVLGIFCKDTCGTFSFMITRGSCRSANNGIGNFGWYSIKIGDLCNAKIPVWCFFTSFCKSDVFYFDHSFLRFYTFFFSSFHSDRYKKNNSLFFHSPYEFFFIRIIFLAYFRFNRSLRYDVWACINS